MKLARVSDNLIYYIPDYGGEADMIEHALKNGQVIEVYQRNDLIGHIDRDGFHAVPFAPIAYEATAPRIYAFIPALTNEYIQIMPGTYSERRAVLLEEEEFQLLFALINERIVEATQQGIPHEHHSQQFRLALLKKLTLLLRKPLVMVSEPPQSVIEAYEKSKERKE
jgi:hypothetical protein